METEFQLESDFQAVHFFNFYHTQSLIKYFLSASDVLGMEDPALKKPLWFCSHCWPCGGLNTPLVCSILGLTLPRATVGL